MEEACAIIVKIEFEAIHFWEDAASFLKFPHYHKFFVEFGVNTKPGDMDRTLEFFDIKDKLGQIIKEMLIKHDESPLSFSEHLQFDSLGYKVVKLSTEKMSEEILKGMEASLGHQGLFMHVKIMEDNFNGSETHRSYIG